MRKHARKRALPENEPTGRSDSRGHSIARLWRGVVGVSASLRSGLSHVSASAAMPIAAFALSILAFLVAGRSVPQVVETNLPNPPVRVAEDPIRLAHPTFAVGDRYVLSTTQNGSAPAFGSKPRLKIQLYTEGRSRLLIVREEGSVWPRLQVVPHLGWIDFGPPPARGTGKTVTVKALLGGPFAFVSPNVPKADSALGVSVVADGLPKAIVAVRPLRYRLVENRSLTWKELLARLFYFPTRGWVTPFAAALAVAGLLLGWRALRSRMSFAGISSAAAAALLSHAALLPPLMGGDETSHAATLEAQLIPHEEAKYFYPSSLSLVAGALEVDRVQFRADEALPVEGEESRARLTALLDRNLLEDARLKGEPPPTGIVIEADARAPAYYALIARLARPFTGSAIVDRLAAYRLFGVTLVALLVALTLATTAIAGAGRWLALATGLVLLLPYSVAVVASTSNYSPAIGFGLLGAAGVVAGVVGTAIRGRLTALSGGLFAYVVGIPFWSDFALGLGILFSILPLLAAAALARSGRHGPGRVGLFIGGAVLLCGFALVAGGGSVLARVVAGLPRAQTALDTLFRADVQARLPYAGAPLLLLLAGLIYIRVVAKSSKDRARSLARRVSALLAIFVLGGASTLPWTGISYGYVQAPRGEQLSDFLRSILSNALSWDQDLLGWKLWWGVFGWADTFSSPLVYAIARWGLTLLVVASPMLVLPFVRRRPQQAALLFAIACFGLTTMAVSFLIRLNGAVFPYGRFFLPFFPLVALPFLAMLQAPGRLRKLQGVFRVAVLFHIWVAVYTLGTRYCFGK